jgi:hypothetical protein
VSEVELLTSTRRDHPPLRDGSRLHPDRPRRGWRNRRRGGELTGGHFGQLAGCRQERADPYARQLEGAWARRRGARREERTGIRREAAKQKEFGMGISPRRSWRAVAARFVFWRRGFGQVCALGRRWRRGSGEISDALAATAPTTGSGSRVGRVGGGFASGVCRVRAERRNSSRVGRAAGAERRWG